MGGPALGPKGSEDGKVHEVMELIARVQQRLSSEDGATAIEYALMVALDAWADTHGPQNVGSAVSAS